IADFHSWGEEEAQHGRALGHWAEMADPDWNFQQAFARFQAGYKPSHFESHQDVSIRGSRRGEMIARCVVESGTSSYYSAIRDATDEPVLKEIAGRIAADEYRHYKLFYETLHQQDEPEMSFLRRLWVAATRVRESDDDEWPNAGYGANARPNQEAAQHYDRQKHPRLAAKTSMTIYRRRHIEKLVQMVAKAVGANPHGRMADWGGALLWHVMQKKSA